MITYLTNIYNGSREILTLSEKTAQEEKLYETNKQHLTFLLLNCDRDKNYLQLPVAFDIETTNFEQNEMKLSTMYIWQFALKFEFETIFVYGRTWDEWENFISYIRHNIGKKKIIIYVHNLSFEFQFIFTHIFLTKVFARRKRHPIYAESDYIIFKCSYILTNYSLGSLAKNRGYTEKEELDYDLIRHSGTPLTKKELSYALVDVKIITELISEEISKNGKIEDIPLTSTGYARNYCISYLQKNTNFLSYQSKIRKIVPTNEELFGALFKAFSGGFTHANFNYIDITVDDVSCRDKTSFYPSIMCLKRFPMKFFKAKPEHFELFTGKAMLIECEFHKIEAVTPHSILSEHKCLIEGDKLIDNGRVRYAEKLTIMITDLDLETIQKFYSYGFLRINLLYVADYEYLPKEFIMSVLELYKSKTVLKGVIGEEEKYMRSKELLNSLYGMSVTNPLNDEILFEEGLWNLEEIEVRDGLEKYKNSRKLFTAYQWGVWVTAWARHDLLSDVYDIGDDVVYCDTDSIKCLGAHNEVFDNSDKKVFQEISEISKRYNIPREYFFPKTMNGEEKALGEWDSEPSYSHFKTLGAKRYCFSYYDNYFEKNKKKMNTEDNFFTTVAGISKKASKAYIIKEATRLNLSPFDVFSYELYENNENYLIVPKEYSEKLTSHYSEQGFSATLTDYLGNSQLIKETSFINLEKIPFEFRLSNDLSKFLELIFTIRENSPSFDEGRFKFTKEN